MPNFVIQRSLYEVRERPSKTYSWIVFILSNIIVEIPWSVLVATMFFFEWYYPIGYYRNAIPTGTVALRGAMAWLFMQMFFLFTSTFAIMVVAAMDLAETAGNLANLAFSLCLIFCGVLVPRQALPGFWVFMNRVSPFTYLTEGFLSVCVANTNVECSDAELLRFVPAGGQTCGAYMAPFIGQVGGYLVDPNATDNCRFCALSSTNTFLAMFNIYWSNAWRDFGLLWAYVCFNVLAAIGLYYIFRVPKHKKAVEDTSDDNGLDRATTVGSNMTRQQSNLSRQATATSANINEKSPVYAPGHPTIVEQSNENFASTTTLPTSTPDLLSNANGLPSSKEEQEPVDTGLKTVEITKIESPEHYDSKP